MTPAIRRGLRLPLIALGIILILFTCSCGEMRTEDLLAYQTQSFSATLAGEANGLSVEATVVHTTEPENLCLTFTAPAALCGITLCREGEQITATLGNMTVDAQNLGTLPAMLSLFTLSGTPYSISADHGTTVAVFDTPHGACTLALDAESGRPHALSCGTVRLDILSFE